MFPDECIWKLSGEQMEKITRTDHGNLRFTVPANEEKTADGIKRRTKEAMQRIRDQN